MSRFRMFVVAFFAVLAFGVVMAASASAETICIDTALLEGLFELKVSLSECSNPLPLELDDSLWELGEFLLAEWLLLGNAIPEPGDLVESEGELTLISLNGGGLGIVAEVLCTGFLDGFVGPGSQDIITEVLTLAGLSVSLVALSGREVECTNTKNCENPLVWAVNLPWLTELELLQEDLGFIYVVLILNKPGWYVECTVIGIKVQETCEAPTEAAIEVSNEANGTVDALFSDQILLLADLPLPNCSLAGNEMGEVLGLGIILPAGGGSLSVSS